jgi:hypothetical protein
MRRLFARAIRGGKARSREITNAGIGLPVIPFGDHGPILAEPPRKLPFQTHSAPPARLSG